MTKKASNPIIGVVAEFNPFHSGHSYLIDKAKKMTGATCVIAAMSGNFTQRGEPAIFDKWRRAEEAVKNGVDLVLEIPCVLSVQSAKGFARGGVGILRSLGIVDRIVFGSETGDTALIRETGRKIMENKDKIGMRTIELAKEGIGYPAAHEKATNELISDKIISPGPNDILAIEYIMAGADEMNPLAIKRTGPGHHETASMIREKYFNEHESERTRISDKYFDLVRSEILRRGPESIEDIAASGSGLGHRLYKTVRTAEDLDGLVESTLSKSYTRSRIMRLLTQTLLGIESKDVLDPMYARVLAMSETGAKILKKVKKSESATVPVITNINKEKDSLCSDAKSMISFDILAGDVYNIIRDKNLYDNCDNVMKPYKA